MTDAIGLLFDVGVDDAVCISDQSSPCQLYCEMTCQLRCHLHIQKHLKDRFWWIWVKTTSVFTIHHTSYHDWLTDQLVNIITSELDKIAPLQQCERWALKPITETDQKMAVKECQIIKTRTLTAREVVEIHRLLMWPSCLPSGLSKGNEGHQWVAMSSLQPEAKWLC